MIKSSFIKSGYPAVQEIIDEFEDRSNQENDELIIPVHWFDERCSVGIRLPFCHKNEMESRKFLRKLNYYTRGNFKFFIFWQTRKIESLFKLKGKNFHPSHVIYRGICNCGVEYVGETARNLEVRVKEHENISKQSEPARHLYSNPSHFFTWSSLRTVYSFVKRRIVKALFITTMNPELNKQVQSYELILFTKGIRIT